MIVFKSPEHNILKNKINDDIKKISGVKLLNEYYLILNQV